MEALLKLLAIISLLVLYVLLNTNNISDERFITYSLISFLVMVMSSLCDRDSRRKLLSYFIVIENK